MFVFQILIAVIVGLYNIFYILSNGYKHFSQAYLHLIGDIHQNEKSLHHSSPKLASVGTEFAARILCISNRFITCILYMIVFVALN